MCLVCDHHMAKNIIESARFESLRGLRLDTATLLADPFKANVDELKIVFADPGRYEFMLTEVYGTDAPDVVTLLCSVQYGKRGATQSNPAPQRTPASGRR